MNINDKAILDAAIRLQAPGSTLTPAQREQATTAAQKSFTGLNWDTAAQRGIEEVVFGTPITPILTNRR